MITKKEVAKLKRLVLNHVNAQINLSWKGSKDPADWEYYEQSAAKAREKLFTFIKSLEEAKS